MWEAFAHRYHLMTFQNRRNKLRYFITLCVCVSFSELQKKRTVIVCRCLMILDHHLLTIRLILPIKCWLFKQLPYKINKHAFRCWFDICAANEMQYQKYMRKCLVKLWLNAIKHNCYNLFFQLVFVPSQQNFVHTKHIFGSTNANKMYTHLPHALNSRQSFILMREYGIDSIDGWTERKRPHRISFKSLKRIKRYYKGAEG